ncbi:MAG: hypothetical protein RMM17_08730 [Acidobacteriota bacterium]|nr:hypothetical protein [Blastocatellia bacterium]MDW8412750.1 hypothetical protein [Acidobacteriota bacterium]
MSHSANSVNIKITGKDIAGRDFNKDAQIEQCGGFGAIIYTEIEVSPGDRVYVRNGSGQVVAIAEVLWRHTGPNPAVEVVLKSSQSSTEELPPLPADLAAPKEEIKQSPPQSVPPPRPGPITFDKKKQETKPEKSALAEDKTPKTPTKPKAAPPSEPKTPAVSPQAAAATNVFRKKLSILLSIISAIFSGVLFSPLFRPAATDFKLVQVTCFDLDDQLNKQPERKGELDAWITNKEGEISFIHKKDITAQQALAEINSQRSPGRRIAGSWCVIDNEVKQVPDIKTVAKELLEEWELIPVGKSASQAPKLAFYLEGDHLTFLEDGADHSQNIVDVMYFEGGKKFIFTFTDIDTETKTALKELKLYVPSTLDAVAEARMLDNSSQAYTATSRRRPEQLDIRFAAAIACAVVTLLAGLLAIFFSVKK